MSFLVTVRFVDCDDSKQPEPFFLGLDAEWTSVDLMLKSMYRGNDDSWTELDTRYWDDEDFVIISSQEELEEACRLAEEKGIMQLYVRTQEASANAVAWPEPIRSQNNGSSVDSQSSSQTSDSQHSSQTSDSQPSSQPASSPSVSRDRRAKRTAEEAFRQQPQALDLSLPSDPSTTTSDTTVANVTQPQSSAAAAPAADDADVGAADQEHTILPGASSGANVIAIEMPECAAETLECAVDMSQISLEVLSLHAGDQRGTEAAEPAEMAETGEVTPKSGRDAETGFWMVPKDEATEKITPTTRVSFRMKEITDSPRENSPKDSQKGGKVKPNGSPKETKDTAKVAKPKGSQKEAKDTAKVVKPKGSQRDARPKEGGHASQKEARAEETAAVLVSYAVNGKRVPRLPSTAEKGASKRKQQSQTDVLTQEAFLDFMAKYQSELRHDIVKDVTRKTVRQVVEGVGKLHTNLSDPSCLLDSRPKWPISTHDKIICDNCDSVIVGPRYKCGNCSNYDLCAACEGLYPPVHTAAHVFLKLHRTCPKAGVRHGVRTPLLKRTLYPAVTTETTNEEKKKETAELERLNEMADRLRLKEVKVKERLARKQERLERKMADLSLSDPLQGRPFGVLSAEFVEDVTYPDGSVVSPCRILEKTWLMRNNGTLSWPKDTVLCEVRGDLSADQTTVEVGLVSPGVTFPVTALFCSPEQTGNFESFWRLHSKGLAFGHYVFIKIRVDNDFGDFLQTDLQKKILRREKEKKKSKKLVMPQELPPLAMLKPQVAPPLTLREDGASGAQTSKDSTLPQEIFLDLSPGFLTTQAPANTNNPSNTKNPSNANNTNNPTSDKPQQLEGPFQFDTSSVDGSPPLSAESQGEVSSAEQPDVADQMSQLTAHAIPMMQLTPSAPICNPDEDVQTESTAQDAADSGPELLDSDGFVMCPCPPQTSDHFQRDLDSADDDLYTSASDPKALLLEMPTLGASPVTTGRDTDLEALPLTTGRDSELEAARQERELSPGSTASSVEVVTLCDLADLEEEEEEFSSIDTHGAWLSPHQTQLVSSADADVAVDGEAGGCEGYEILDDWSVSDESSLDEDFCVVVPDCFDMSKPLRRDAGPDALADMCRKRMDQHMDPACSEEAAAKQPAGQTSAEETGETRDAQGEEEEEAEEEEVKEEDREEEEEEEEEESKEEEVKEEEEEESKEEEVKEAEVKEAEVKEEEVKEEEVKEEEVKEEETEVKIERKEEEGAASSPGLVVVSDPGQQLNQLIGSTMKAASSGLCHLYRTTKDVIKTLQAEPQYQSRESSYEFKPSAYKPPTSSWKPSNTQYTPPKTQYVPPRNDYKPPQSDYKPPKSDYKPPTSDYIPPKSDFPVPNLASPVHKSREDDTETSGAGGEFAGALARIREMGYFNNQRSLALLQKHSGDIHRVVDELCVENDNDWVSGRH